jgi:uncharacterized protein YbcI
MQSTEGFEQIHRARTKMIQEYYKQHKPDDLEELMGTKLLNLFSDINIEEDMAISVFVFENPIRGDYNSTAK